MHALVFSNTCKLLVNDFLQVILADLLSVHFPTADGCSLAPPRGESVALVTSDQESTPMSVSSLTGSALSSKSSQTSSAIARLKESPDSVLAETGPSSELCQDDLQHRCFSILPEAKDFLTSHQVLLRAILMVRQKIFALFGHFSDLMDMFGQPVKKPTTTKRTTTTTTTTTTTKKTTTTPVDDYNSLR